MKRRLNPRFWVETVMAAASGALFLLAIVWRDWIELVFGINPDQGNGSLEWGVVVISLAAAVTLGGLAGNEWRKSVPSVG